MYSNSYQSIDYLNRLYKRTLSASDLFKIIKDADISENTSIIKNLLFFENNYLQSCNDDKHCDSLHKGYRKSCIYNCVNVVKTAKNIKRKKVSEDDFTIPSMEGYTNIIINNYTMKQLKIICKHYKQKVSGNKDELQNRLFTYLIRSSDVKIIQRKWRSHIIKKYNIIRGPARYKRSLCINDTDFCSMENLNNISYKQFISYKDVDNKIYGFELSSLFTLLSKGDLNTTNPYNRKVFPRTIRKNINTIVRLSQIIGDKIIIEIEEPEEISPQKQIEQNTIEIFHEMDLLGNYTNPVWFSSLGRASLIRFIRELADIWSYRAQLSEYTKREICPPHGNPFGDILVSLLNYTTDILKNKSLAIIKQMVKHGVNNASQCLGTNYVLCAFTLVNENAREALPWLYQSVA